jgi:cytochrome oxidase Cu insertion factor (SCO1/SenC/PrrC family)
MEAGAGSRLHSGSGWVAAGLITAVLLVALVIGVAIGVGLHSVRAQPAPAVVAPRSSAGLQGQATWGPGARPAPAITTLRDQTRHLFALRSLRGHTVAIVFFDSHCHQACPLEGRALAAAEGALPRAQRPVIVAVSVNPLDSPASTRAAVAEWGLSRLSSWHWLMGSHAALAPVWHAYRVVVVPEKGDISHTEAVYLIDRRGYERSAYLYPFMPRFVTNDLRTLADTRKG